MVHRQKCPRRDRLCRFWHKADSPLTEEEVQQLGIEKHEIVVAYSEGDSVRINDGPLTSFIGTVDQIDIEKNKVRVIVSMFGRETPVELELDQVELVND